MILNPSDLNNLPDEIKKLKQFCVRVGKQPYVLNRIENRPVPQGWQADTDKWMTFNEAMKIIEACTEVFHDGARWKVEGMGILMLGTGRDEPQDLGGDLDCCRDPETGALSPWAERKLNGIKPYHTEVSLSGCGIRFFVKGRLPEGRKFITGFGPQHDMPEETIRKILRAKPKAADKILRQEPAFNGLEFHESSGIDKNTGKYSAKHLTVTGQKLEKFCFPVEDRTAAIAESMIELIEDKPPAPVQTIRALPETQWLIELEKASKMGSLPQLNILAVIGRKVDLSQFTMSGGQLLGPHYLGSSTGRNLVINPEMNTYAYMHYPNRPGGDAWVWLAHECGSAPWDMPGEGLLKNPAVKNATVAYAISQKLIAPQQIIKEPVIRPLKPEDEAGSMGLWKDGTVRAIALNPKGEREVKWLSDCAVILHTETREDDLTEFTFFGIGARDGFKKCWTVQAADMSDNRKFRGQMLNALGSSNRIGQLTFDIVQSISWNTIKKQRVTTPRWQGNIPLVPGLDLMGNVEFKLSPLTPAQVYDGDLDAALNVLKKLIVLRKYTPILVTAVLGSPVYAKWFTQDRFGIALWGKTGSQKTTIARLATTIYGTDFYQEYALVKHGKAGSTGNAAMEGMLNAGFLPRILDDVKAVSPRDLESYVATIHAVMEGVEKLRSRREGGLRKPNKYLTTPIITGEIRPAEASTSARVLNLIWSKVNDSQELAAIQEDMSLLPVIGYHWLRYLATLATDPRTGFEEARTRRFNEYINKGYANPGRLATIYCLLRSVWVLARDSPFGELFKELEPIFLKALDDAIAEQGVSVTEETEVSKFLEALNEIISSEPDLFMVEDIPTASDVIVGRLSDLGLFVLPNAVLSHMMKMHIFTQMPNRASLTNALIEEGVLVPSKSKDHKLYQVRVNGVQVRGWLFKPDWNSRFLSSNQSDNLGGEPTGDPKPNSSDSGNRITGPTAVQEKKCSDNIENINEKDAVTAVNAVTAGTYNIDNREIDRDNTNISSPLEGNRYGNRVSTDNLDPNNTINTNKSPNDIDNTGIISGHDTEIRESIDWILRHLPRKDGDRLGLKIEDLAQRTKYPVQVLEAYLKSAGWEKNLQGKGAWFSGGRLSTQKT